MCVCVYTVRKQCIVYSYILLLLCERVLIIICPSRLHALRKDISIAVNVWGVLKGVQITSKFYAGKHAFVCWKVKHTKDWKVCLYICWIISRPYAEEQCLYICRLQVNFALQSSVCIFALVAWRLGGCLNSESMQLRIFLALIAMRGRLHGIG